MMVPYMATYTTNHSTKGHCVWMLIWPPTCLLVDVQMPDAASIHSGGQYIWMVISNMHRGYLGSSAKSLLSAC